MEGVKTRELAEPAVRTRTDCRMCHSDELVKLWSFGQTPLANSYLKPEEVGVQEEVWAPLDVYLCQSCHLVQLLDVVSQHLLFDHYLYVSSTSPSFVAHFQSYAEALMARFGLDNEALVVDVGSNDGVLLKPLQEAGVRVLGIDPAQNVAALANESGIPTEAEYFLPDTAEKLVEKHGKAKVMSANNVFAHTDFVDEFVSAVDIMLEDEGVFVFEVQYLGDLLEHNLFDIVYHEHVCYYSVHPLIGFFERHNMEVFDVERIPVHGGSIRVFVSRKGAAQHTPSERLQEILTEEEERGLTTLGPYEEFGQRIERNKEALQEMLGSLKAQGKRIAGYGAPAKATTLMSVFGLDGQVLDFIVDDSPLKQGLVMPGTHVPIVDAQRLYEEDVDYCFILAWNFAEPIMKTHTRFAEQGGQFIIPVPKPTIII